MDGVLTHQLFFVFAVKSHFALNIYPRKNHITSMGKQKIREMREAKEAAIANTRQLDGRNDAYTTGAFKYLRFLVHFLAAAQFIYGAYYLLYKMPQPDHTNAAEVRKHWGGKFKFLTFLGTLAQATYHIIALLNDFFGDNTVDGIHKSKLRRLRDYFFASFALPLALNVSISFWVIYAYDRELIFPTALDAIFPNWLNHVVHTNVAMMVIIDMFTCCRIYPHQRSGLSGCISFMLLYICWLHIVRFNSGEFPYPIFEVVNWPLRYLLMIGLVGFHIFCYLVGSHVNKFVWAPEFELLQQQRIKQS